MLDAFKIKPFDLEPVLTEWKEGPVFKGNPKKDMPVEEWLGKIKQGCVERGVPEEYWYKVGQHFMGRKARARFEEVKQVVSKVNGGKYRWTWKKFKVAMLNMGWEIDSQATETIKVGGKSSGFWFMRKKSEDKELPAKPEPSSSKDSKEAKRTPPSRSNTLRWTKKPVCEEPEEISSRPLPTRSSTLAGSSFWSMRRDSKEDETPKEDKKEGKSRPVHQKAQSETAVTRRNRSETRSEISRSGTTDNGEVTTVAHAPVWLLNACTALDFLTSEHPKAMSVISAVLITVGSIPTIPAVAAGAGGAILASGAAQAIGAIAVGLGQALGASAVKGTPGQEQGHGSGH